MKYAISVMILASGFLPSAFAQSDSALSLQATVQLAARVKEGYKLMTNRDHLGDLVAAKCKKVQHASIECVFRFDPSLRDGQQQQKALNHGLEEMTVTGLFLDGIPLERVSSVQVKRIDPSSPPL